MKYTTPILALLLITIISCKEEQKSDSNNVQSNLKMINAESILTQIRNSKNQSEFDSQIQNIECDEYIPAGEKYPKDKNLVLRGELIDLLLIDFTQKDHLLLQKIADIEMKYTTSIGYHHRQAEVVFMLYELGNKEDIFRAYDVKYRSRNMDAAGAAYDATLTMRTPKVEMLSFIKSELNKRPQILDKYPDILESIEFSYEFSYEFSIYGSREKFNKQLVGYYYGGDRYKEQRFYDRIK